MHYLKSNMCINYPAISDAEEMLQCMERVQKHLSSANISVDDSKTSSGISTSDNLQKLADGIAEGGNNDGKTMSSAESLIRTEDFRRLLKIHNKIQAVQCFQYPPNALCCDSKELVREVRRIFNDFWLLCLLGFSLFLFFHLSVVQQSFCRFVLR